MIDAKDVRLRELHTLLTPDHFTTGVVPPLSTLSERLSGKGLDWVLTEAVIDVCAEGAVAARRTSEAKRLWAMHRHSPTPVYEESPPASVATAPTANSVVDAQRQTIEAQAQLVRAVEARAASEQALTNSTQLISALLVMIGRLNDQITGLERATNPTDRLRSRLATARRQLIHAEAEMARAETEQQEALFLVQRTDDRVGELKEALQILNWNGPIPDDSAINVWSMTGLVERASDPSDAVFLGDVSDSLRRVHQAIDECVQLIRSSRPVLPGGASSTRKEDPPAVRKTAQSRASSLLRSVRRPERPEAISRQHVWQSDEWHNPFPEVIQILNDLYQHGTPSQLDHILRDVSLLPADELTDGLIALRNAGHETALRRVLKLVADRPGDAVFDVVLNLRKRLCSDDAERLIWDFTLRQRGTPKPFDGVSAPRQRTVDSWFTRHYGPVPRFRPDRWEFRVFGATAIPGRVSFTLEQFQELPTSRLAADLHCVTKQTWPNNDWGGVMVSTLFDIAPPAASVTHLMVWAEYGYSSNLRLSDVLDGRAILATHNNGEPLSPEHGFPLRLVVPHLYGYKAPKWLRGIEYMTSDRRGFWEERGYHNLGEVQHEQRYSYQEEPGQGPLLDDSSGQSG